MIAPTKTERLPFHPFAAVFPLIVGDDFDSLVEDIRQHGLLEDIHLHPDGSILDGRNRYLACEKAGVEPRFVTYNGATDADSILAFVLSVNLHRRHLTSDQRACCASKAVGILKHEKQSAMQRQVSGKGADGSGGRGNKKTFPKVLGRVSGSPKSHSGEVNERVAKLFGTNRDYLRAAIKLSDSDPDAFKAVETGQKRMVQVKREQKEQAREERREHNRTLVSATPDMRVALGMVRFATIVVDPPWDYTEEELSDMDAFGRALPTYVSMTTEQIMKTPVANFADEDCHIYLWITNRLLPRGFSLLKEWGFRYVTCLTWCKPSFGMGNYFRGSTEQILFGVKGSQPLKRKNAGTWFQADRGPNGHSSKPVGFYDLVESCSPGPFLEVFARSGREGWAAYGAESQPSMAVTG